MDAGAIIWLAFLIAFLIGLVWAIVARSRQKQTEDFEQRDN